MLIQLQFRISTSQHCVRHDSSRDPHLKRPRSSLTVLHPRLLRAPHPPIMLRPSFPDELHLSADVLPLSTLCIHPERAAWVLYLDATCINYDGNAFDAALIAMVAALKNSTVLLSNSCHVICFWLTMDTMFEITATLPKATYSEETGRTTCTRRIREPLPLKRLMVSYSFGVFDGYHGFPLCHVLLCG